MLVRTGLGWSGVAKVDTRVVSIEAMWLQDLGADAPLLAAHTHNHSACTRAVTVSLGATDIVGVEECFYIMPCGHR